MDYEFYEMRIATINDAASRSRWVLVVSSIASVAIIGASWNAFPQGIYDVASYLWAQSDFTSNQPTAELQKALLKGWVEGMFVNIPILGIRFSITDAWLLGSMALVILAIWQFYTLRRENHLIGGLLRDVIAETSKVKSYVFHGVCGTQVFATLTDDDHPINSLTGTDKQPLPTVRFVAKILIYLPVAAILFIIVSDLASIFLFSSIFRNEHLPLMEIARRSNDSQKIIAFLLTNGMQEIVALIFGFFTWFLLWRSTQFQNGTIALLRETSGQNWGTTTAG